MFRDENVWLASIVLKNDILLPSSSREKGVEELTKFASMFGYLTSKVPLNFTRHEKAGQPQDLHLWQSGFFFFKMVSTAWGSALQSPICRV